MTIIRSIPIEQPQKLSFKNCKLDREKYADVLTNMICTHADGFVMSIDGKWGTGKSTFINMWQQKLKDDEFEVIHFNAWENDFEKDPLIALLGEIKTLVNKDPDQYKNLLKKGLLFTKQLLPSIAEAVAANYIDKDILKKGIKNASEGLISILEDEVNQYAEKKAGLSEFRTQLEHFIGAKDSKKPVVFFIDELDRCRPDYAVDVLEKVKHFFSTKGMVFILSIDKTELKNAVKGVFGSENMDADEYLRRFIDVEYHLPEPNRMAFADYLFVKYKIDAFFNEEIRRTQFGKEASSFRELIFAICSAKNLTLRQMEKFLVRAKIGLNAVNMTYPLLPNLYVLLLFIHEYHYSFFRKLKLKQASINEILEDLKDIIDELKLENRAFKIHLEATLAYRYLAANTRINISAQTNGTSDSNRTTELPSQFDDSEGKNAFANCFDKESLNYYHLEFRHVTIDYLLDKISLTTKIDSYS